MTIIDAELAKSLGLPLEKCTPVPVTGIGSRHLSSAFVSFDAFFCGAGGLIDPDGEMQVILEVKAMHLSARSKEQEFTIHRSEGRWVMLAQYATEIYFVVAELHEEYIDIYSAKEMEVFGFIVAALTIIQHRDWKKSKKG
ncbi:hypothetical protein N7527_000910 [Penicillium freii]|nr:hypothetical protein N7527_000910 [Penicillium freii]